MPAAKALLSQIQNIYENRKNTADIVGANKWLSAKVQKNKVQYKILLYDMINAFDTVDLKKNMSVFRHSIETQYGIFSPLLKHTKLHIQFINYEEATLRWDVRREFPQVPLYSTSI